MKHKFFRIALAVVLCLALLCTTAMAAPRTGATDGRLVISEAGDYTITGNMRGQIYVDPGAGDVTLTLDNVTIDSGSAAGIVAVSGDNLTIRTTPGSVNSIRTENTGSGLDAGVRSSMGYSFRNEGQLRVNGSAVNASVYQAANSNRLNVFVRALMEALSRIFRSSGASVPAAQESPAFQPAQQQSAPSGEMGGSQPAQPTQPSESDQTQTQPTQPSQQTQPSGEMGGSTIQSSTGTAGEVVEGTTYNSAMDLEADYDNATTYTLTDEDGNVTISESGTYVVTGSSSDGSITVKKGTTGVVLVLEDLDLTSTTSATLSVNKQAEVQVVISGSVTLTDAENPDDEYSEDADVADAYDGAAIKVKAESVVFITGDGTLTINGDAKNGIKGGDDSSIIIGGDVEIDITAANDGINSNYDVTILSGDITIDAEDDGIHADHILTIGDAETGEGPNLTVTDSTEGIEATVVNVYGGDIDVTASDDGINAANGDGVYEGELEYSYNQMGGNVTVRTSADGIDSNGNVNLIGGSATIRSASNGGDAGIDYDGELYISGEYVLNNQNGVAGPDNMMGGMFGPMNGMNGASGEMRR